MKRMIRGAGRRVAQSDPPDLAVLVELEEIVKEAVREAVVGQRSSGITWDWIAEATGTTRPAAIQKWSKYCLPR